MKTGKEAARAFKQKQSNKVGLCLWECQEIYPTNHWYPNAIGQWHNAKKKHTNKNAPVGAPMYYKGGKHGHIVLYVGDGMVRSTDAGGPGKMGTVPIEWFKRAWGYEYLGWSEDLGGKDIEFDRTKHVYVKQLRRGVDDSNSVKLLRRALIKRGFLKVSAPLSADRPGDKYTEAVVKAVAKWEKKKGYAKQNGILSNEQAEHFFRNNKHIKVHPK
jgi:hypothetical protein